MVGTTSSSLGLGVLGGRASSRVSVRSVSAEEASTEMLMLTRDASMFFSFAHSSHVHDSLDDGSTVAPYAPRTCEQWV